MRLNKLPTYLAFGVLPILISTTYAETSVARRGLLSKQSDGRPIPAEFTEAQLNADGMVCIRFNNYWCMKSFNWEGEVGHDARGHAMFDDPAYAARAVARQFKTWWFRDRRNTAFKVMSAYAPPTDCRGSVGKPPNCKWGINPTAEYAATIARAVGKGADDDLQLFDKSTGTLNREVAIPLMKAIAAFELPRDFTVTDELIREGIDKSGL